MTFAQASLAALTKIQAQMENAGTPGHYAIGALAQCRLTGEIGEILAQADDGGPYSVRWTDTGEVDCMAAAMLQIPRS